MLLACSSPFAEKLAEIPHETLALLGVLIIDTPTPYDLRMFAKLKVSDLDLKIAKIVLIFTSKLTFFSSITLY